VVRDPFAATPAPTRRAPDEIDHIEVHTTADANMANAKIIGRVASARSAPRA
jgi:hypothetical protein